MGNIPQDPAAEKRSGANNPSSNQRNRRQKDRQFLPVLPVSVLETIYRGFDDLPETVSVAGFPASTVALIGYKFSVAGCSNHLSIPRRQIVIGTRNGEGKICGLHNSEKEWYTARTIHLTNLTRAQFTGEIEIYNSTVEADVAAVTRNVASAALNGCTIDDLRLATAHLNARLIESYALEVAA